MRHAPSTLHFSHAFRSPPCPARSNGKSCLRSPSAFASATGRAGAPSPWDATRPAELESAPPSQPFRELKGVAIREVNEPDVFRHFFGR